VITAKGFYPLFFFIPAAVADQAEGTFQVVQQAMDHETETGKGLRDENNIECQIGFRRYGHRWLVFDNVTLRGEP
jgi:hypothetical protein